MAQNTISNELKLTTFLGEYVCRFPVFGNYRIPKLHDSTQDPFSLPLVLSAFRHPCFVAYFYALVSLCISFTTYAVVTTSVAIARHAVQFSNNNCY